MLLVGFGIGQGHEMGAFVRPREEVHNEVFQNVQSTSFEGYFGGGLGV